MLGTVRTFFVVPKFGARNAELMEMPLMLAVTYLAARWIVNRQTASLNKALLLVTGSIALILLLATELTFVLWLRGMTLDEYLASRDPVSGSAYLASLAAFTLMPVLVSRPIQKDKFLIFICLQTAYGIEICRNKDY